jgi:hypothetical protein
MPTRPMLEVRLTVCVHVWSGKATAPELADEWFQENDPEGVAFGYEVSGDETRPRSYCPACGALIDTRDLSQILAHVHDT